MLTRIYNWDKYYSPSGGDIIVGSGGGGGASQGGTMQSTDAYKDCTIPKKDGIIIENTDDDDDMIVPHDIFALVLIDFFSYQYAADKHNT